MRSISMRASCKPVDGPVDIAARMFAPWDGVAEDPATGSATGAAAALIVTREQRPDGLVRLVFSQGVDMGRASRLDVSIDMAAGVAKQIRVGGLCAAVMSGELQL